MKNLFAFVFELSTPSATNKITATVYQENYEKACNAVLELELPIVARDIEDFDDSLKEVFQCTSDEESPESN